MTEPAYFTRKPERIQAMQYLGGGPEAVQPLLDWVNGLGGYCEWQGGLASSSPEPLFPVWTEKLTVQTEQGKAVIPPGSWVAFQDGVVFPVEAFTFSQRWEAEPVEVIDPV